MKTNKPELLKWCLACGITCLGFLSLPFLWRSQAFVFVICLGPIIGLGGLIGLVFWLSRSHLGYKPIVTGAVVIGLSLVAGLSGDSVARELIFRLNYGSYRQLVISVNKVVPGKDGTWIEEGKLNGFGVYSAKIVKVKGQQIVFIHTAAGPTLETVAFSQKLIIGPHYVLKR